MAHLYVRQTGERIVEAREVSAFCQTQGIHYEKWNPDRGTAWNRER